VLFRSSDAAADALLQAEETDGVVVSVASLVDLWYVTQTTKSITEAELAELREKISAAPELSLQPIDEDVADGCYVALDPADLAWNRSDQRFWFHYTDRAAARVIATRGIYKIGDRHPKAPGLYVTTVQPGTLGSEELLNGLFDGTRDMDRTQAAVVFADGALTFERVSEHAWRYSAPVNTEFNVRRQILGWAAFEQETWMYSPGVYFPARSRGPG
jgi:hypothetical protein